MISLHKLHRLRHRVGRNKQGDLGKRNRLGRAFVRSFLTLTIVTIMSDTDQSGVVRGDLSTPSVGRLSLYYRELQRLLDNEVHSTNSRDLAALVNVSAAVVRRDLSSIQSTGQRGVGYDVASLTLHIGEVLGSGVQWKAVLIGVGSLGNALLRYKGFERLGFTLAAAFDTDPDKFNRIVGGVPIRSLDELEPILREHKPELAIIAVPSEHAIEVAGRVVALGIQGILNFAPTTIRVSSGVAIINVDLASELQQLAFRIQHG